MTEHIDQQSEIDAINGTKPSSFLSKAKNKRKITPPTILIYGHQGHGKTTLACEFPNPIVFNFEDGIPDDVNVFSIEQKDLKTYDDMIAGLRSLAAEDHDYDTLVIDSIDALEPLLVAEVCKKMHVTRLSETKMGSGYKEVDLLWRSLLKNLKWLNEKKNMTVILIGHAKTMTYEDAIDGAYSKQTINLSNQGRDAVLYLTSNVLFLSQESRIETKDLGFNQVATTAKSHGSRVLYCDARPAHEAKNRCGLPHKISIEKGQGYAAIASYLTTQPN